MNRRRLLAWLLGVGGVAVAVRAVRAYAQSQVPRQITVSARKFSYSPSRIEVQRDDLVTITLEAVDIPHSFTIDAYRIAKRASPGQSVTFEFRADQTGSFPYYCNLAQDDGCRKMRFCLRRGLR
jgi:cytochrome c oxidase subunit 2